MTYFGFLLWFLVLPIVILLGLHGLDRRRGRGYVPGLGRYPLRALALLVLIAVVYTTPWDNYLVAKEVWGYPPERVVGVVLGYVPLEEYTFFVLQTVMTGLWVLWLARRLPGRAYTPRRRSLPLLLGALGAMWLLSVGSLTGGVRPAFYLSLILVWALPPVMLQVAFGKDILSRHGRLAALGLAVPTLYLWAADTYAIRDGIWAINPLYKLGLHLPGGLPVEEAVFFLATNVLITFGLVLAASEEAYERFSALRHWMSRRKGSTVFLQLWD
jgi:lycopene cyclase domain-containing protein